MAGFGRIVSPRSGVGLDDGIVDPGRMFEPEGIELEGIVEPIEIPPS